MVTDNSKFRQVLGQRGVGAQSLLNLLQAVCLHIYVPLAFRVLVDDLLLPSAWTSL